MSEQVRSSFRRWDIEGTGVILKDDLISLLRSLDPEATDGEISTLFSAARIQDEETIRYEKFVSWLFFDIPIRDIVGKLEEINSANEDESLWEIALRAAAANATKKFPKAKVDTFFDGVRKRITEQEFSERVQRTLSEQCSNAQNGTVSFDEALPVAASVVQCSSNLAATAMPTPNEIRDAFNAHDIKAGALGHLAVDDVLNLTRYVQVRVALATLMETEARSGEDRKLLRSNKDLRGRGLWEGALTSAKAKAYQRYDEAAVDSYYAQVQERLCSREYEEHVKGAFFTQVDANKDGKVSFGEAQGIITSTLVCSADLGGMQKPTEKSIREVFDAHDTIVQGWDYLGGDEFLNLMRYLQVQVAEAMLPLSLTVKPGK